MREDVDQDADQREPDPEPLAPPGGGWTVRILLAFLLLGVGGAVGYALVTGSEEDEAPTVAVPATVAPGDADAAVPPGPDGTDRLAGWSVRLASLTGLDERVLRAYGNAELIVRGDRPDCRLSWATLAGIAKIESNHGRFGDIDVGPDGRTTRPIVGPPLDGSPGVRTILDTDGGRLDGDTRFDRAVGPFQFLPGTWRRYGTDGNGDGIADPHNIEDASVAAGRYLCAQNRDLSAGRDWWDAVLEYNNSLSYGRKVFDAADSYAKASLG